jgi:superfamily II DNA or RNA helicase
MFTTYLSLHKKNPSHYDVVVLDECHSLLISHTIFLAQFTGRILGLTGTPPRHHQSEKGKMVHQFCPILYKYITDDAVSDDILNDYRIIVHTMPISNVNSLPVNMKDGKQFYTS